MNGPLHPYFPYDDTETTESYLRRLSLYHTGRDGPGLLADFGIKLRDFSSGETDAVATLANITGVEAHRLRAGMFLHRPRYREFRDEVVSIDFVRAEGAVVCPECLREDAADWHRWSPKGRISWRMRALQTCPYHNCRLVQTSGVAAEKVPSDVFIMLERICELEAEPQAPTALEQSILNRLSGTSSGAGLWLDTQTMEQGVRACEMVGATLTHGLTFTVKALTAEDWRQAGAIGFEIARGGADAMTVALSQIAAMSTTTAGQAGPKAVYGRLYEWLGYNSPVPDPGPIRGLLRENILNTMVIEPDEVLLGERVHERRLHSVYSLSIATRLHLKRLRKILVQAGVTDEETWDIAANRLVFPVAEAERLCADIMDSVSLQQLPDAIGCSRTQAQSLYQEGVVRPVVEPDALRGISKLAFARRNLDAFLSIIEKLPAASPGQAELVDFTSACKRTGRSTGDIMARIISGDLDAWRDGRQVSVHSIRFYLSDLDPIRTRQPRSGEKPD